MSHTRQEKLEALGRVIDTLDILRVKCPWDAKQTNQSLRPNTIEEAFELAQALIDNNNETIKKELGDVLLHILFYAKIGQENNAFDIADVADALNNKLIFRHPHVFGTTQVDDAHQVEQNWEQLKLKEKDGNRSVLAGVPAALPALVKAFRIQEKAANVGFDWEDKTQVWDKFREEATEVEQAVDAAAKHNASTDASPIAQEHDCRQEIENELGDLLFSLINVCRLYGVNPENALERTNRKFISRFNFIEDTAKQQGRELKSMTLEQMDALWNQAKRQLDNK